MWDFLPIEDLLEVATAGNYGLAPARFREQIVEIRALPETEPERDR
jgi:hypothetical protein